MALHRRKEEHPAKGVITVIYSTQQHGEAMSRLADVVKFINFDRSKNLVFEPQVRYEALRDRLFDTVKTYNPGVIVKTGIGGGKLLAELAGNFKSRIVAVEPSAYLIDSFLEQYGAAEAVKRISIINGDFSEFPVDYYKADMIVSADYLDIFDLGRCVDEFKRALQFEGIFFFAGTILADEDMEGIYDDFMKVLCPLHNDYYLLEDFKTVMTLKDFTFVKSMVLNFSRDLRSAMDYYGVLFGADARTRAREFLHDHRAALEEIYGLTEDDIITERYLIGIYMRNKPPKEE